MNKTRITSHIAALILTVVASTAMADSKDMRTVDTKGDSVATGQATRVNGCVDCVSGEMDTSHNEDTKQVVSNNATGTVFTKDGKPIDAQSGTAK